ncbi:MAG: glycosyltransferase [Gammaproteobacteria bacterium]|nr:glycosyltransferase [Gammaproteobacteria bacterium]
MLHIALITTSYPEHTPGTEAAGSFVEDFARELSRHVRVTVVAASTMDSFATEGRLSVKRFAVPRLPLSLLNPLMPTHWKSIVQSLRAGESALEELADRDRPDHILALWVLPSGYWADRVARRHQLKYSVWALGSDIWTLGKVPLVRQILRRVLRRAERRYADGIQLSKDVETLGGLPCDFLPSTRLLPTGGPAKRSVERQFNLAFLGRWHKNKGTDLLVDALGLLTDQDWDRISEVRIYGGGPMHDLVHQAAHALKLQGRPVMVGGYLDKDAAATLINWADYLLLPSRIESIPVIFSDAMQLHTPIIATPVGDLPRLFDKHKVGVLATRAAASEYADAIQRGLRQNVSDFGAAIDLAAKDFDLAFVIREFVSKLETPLT